MKKTININLGGHPFTIDQDAYESLDKYLSSLQKYFKSHEGGEEIMEDIEIRIAELFAEQVKPYGIVSQKNVESVISTMGTIDAFISAESEDSNTTNSNASSESQGTHQTYITGKKLFRNEEQKIIAGVCSGLSAYFGIKNPWWVRIAFLLFSGAGTPLIYLILWLAVSPARTSSDRLAMQGEPINITTIVKTIEDEVMDLKDKIEDIGRDLTKK